MAGTKRYGIDGPPQLVGRSRCVSADELLGWFRQTQEPTWAHWSDAERKRRLDRRLSRPGEWFRKVVCPCGRDDDFRVLSTNPLKPLISRDGIEFDVVHLDLVCNSCSRNFAVFDNQLNGWNAVVCGDTSTLPSDYKHRVRKSLEPRSCSCGSSDFECLVWYCYDAEADDLVNVPLDQWDEAFGAFAAWIICSSCKMAQQVADAETA
jgi:hypothetical protein